VVKGSWVIEKEKRKKESKKEKKRQNLVRKVDKK